MDRFDFNKQIDIIENNCPGKTYSAGEREEIIKNIHKRMKPTKEEMKHVIDYIIEIYGERDYPQLPGSGAISRALISVRKNKTHVNTLKIPCEFGRCESAGFLAVEHPDADRYILGCGCGNTPAWVEPELYFTNLLRRGLIKDSEVTTIKRQPIFDDKRTFQSDRWQKIVDIYLAEEKPGDAFIPNWMRKRFDDANFDYPESFPLCGKIEKPKMKTVDEVPF